MEYKQFYNYLIYENGDVYSIKRKKFMSPDIVHGYRQFSLSINKKAVRYKAHQLVAMLWLGEKPEGYIIDHKDGNKSNNHYSNLEYVTYYENNKRARDKKLNDVSKSNSERWKDDSFRKRTSSNISRGLKESGCSLGKNNPRFRYLVKDNTGKEYSRQELATLINKSQSYTDACIKRASRGEILDFFVFNQITITDTKTIESIDYRKSSAKEKFA